MQPVCGRIVLPTPGGPIACYGEEPGLEFVLILLLPPKCWDWMCELPCLALRSLSMLVTGKVFSQCPKACASSVHFCSCFLTLCMGRASFCFCMFCTFFLLEPEQLREYNLTALEIRCFLSSGVAVCWGFFSDFSSLSLKYLCSLPCMAIESFPG